MECAGNYRSGFKLISIGSRKMLSGLILSSAGGERATITSSSVIVSRDRHMISVVIGHILAVVLLSLQMIVFLVSRKMLSVPDDTEGGVQTFFLI